jgi:hypothetical protein
MNPSDSPAMQSKDVQHFLINEDSNMQISVPLHSSEDNQA